MVGRQVEFLSHARAGGVVEGKFAVGGVLQLAAAHAKAFNHLRKAGVLVCGIAFAHHLVHFRFLVIVQRRLQIGAVLGGDFGERVGLELVQNVSGGGFQHGAADGDVFADAVFGQHGFVSGIFQLGLALDVMDFVEQRFFGGGFGAGVELGVGLGLRGAAGVLAHALQIRSQLGHKGGGDDDAILNFRKRGGVVGNAVNEVGLADFGELVFVQKAVGFWGFGCGCGCGCGVSHNQSMVEG